MEIYLKCKNYEAMEVLVETLQQALDLTKFSVMGSSPCNGEWGVKISPLGTR